jgi:hypothetical protein
LGLCRIKVTGEEIGVLNNTSYIWLSILKLKLKVDRASNTI